MAAPMPTGRMWSRLEMGSAAAGQAQQAADHPAEQPPDPDEPFSARPPPELVVVPFAVCVAVPSPLGWSWEPKFRASA